MTSRRSSVPFKKESSSLLDPVDDFKLHNWEAKSLTGIRSARFSNSKAPVDRWQLLQFAARKVLEWQSRAKELRCWISVPLDQN